MGKFILVVSIIASTITIAVSIKTILDTKKRYLEERKKIRKKYYEDYLQRKKGRREKK